MQTCPGRQLRAERLSPRIQAAPRLDECGRGSRPGRPRGSPVATGGELDPLLLGSAVVGDVCVFPSAKTVNASVLQSDLESLARMTSYTVWVMASTSAGGTNGTRINFKTLSMSECPLPAPRVSRASVPGRQEVVAAEGGEATQKGSATHPRARGPSGRRVGEQREQRAGDWSWIRRPRSLRSFLMGAIAS